MLNWRSKPTDRAWKPDGADPAGLHGHNVGGNRTLCADLGGNELVCYPSDEYRAEHQGNCFQRPELTYAKTREHATASDLALRP